MKVAVIGSTGHVNYVMKGLKETPQAKLVAVAPGSIGETMDKVMRMADQIGSSPALYEDYRDMLDKEQPDIVAVACYFGDHARLAAEALKRGIHVFVEKPIATELEDLSKLKEAYQQSGKHLATMLGMRYMPTFYKAWQTIRDGAIGDIRLMHAQKSYRLGQRGAHFQVRETYGGTIPWVGSHAIDWLYWFSGEKFESVFASHSTHDNLDHGQLEMSALCHFKWSNERYASASMDYLRPPEAPTSSDDRIRIAGTKGILEIRDQRLLLINEANNGIQELALEPEGDIFADFIRQVEQGVPCRVSAEDSFYVTEVCLKARQSADENRLVQL
jgi:predicted dehydrogenase